MEGVVVFVSRTREDALDDLSSDGNGMIVLQMQLAGCSRDDIGWHIEPTIGGVDLAGYLDRRRLAWTLARSSWGGFILSDTPRQS